MPSQALSQKGILGHMQRWIQLVLVILLMTGAVTAVAIPLVRVARADEVADLQKQIDETKRLLDLSVNATTPLEAEVEGFSRRIQAAQATINQLRADQKKKDEEIAASEVAMADQYELFSSRVDQQYRFGRTYSPLTAILSSAANADSQQAIKYTLTLATRDQESIDHLGQNILELQRAKAKAAEEEKRLSSLQQQLDAQSAFFEKEIAGAKAYQAQLNTKIADLSSRQQEIIAAKTGSASTSVGDVPLVGDPASQPTYNPGFSPAFAVFSFGAPHFKGMSQYGALGRAQDGDDYKDILKAYYGDVEIVKVSMPSKITVDGVGSIPFEGQYLKGIAEMPASWADKDGYEALKAQAIASRTYALAYTGWRYSDKKIQRSICATESCQVYTNAKYKAGGRWADAVKDTEGMVVRSKKTGEIFSTMYASTSGGHQLSYTSLGHSTPSLWDTTSNWKQWADGAYEADAKSPWFYKGWYADRGSGKTCGRSHPWLTEKEFADILNAWVVRRKGSSSEVDHVSPLGECWGGDPYSLDEMRSKAKSHGEEYTSVSSVKVSHSESGSTSQVTIQTNRGEVKIDGSEFKEIFNLRAPGRIAIKGKLFNIERK